MRLTIPQSLNAARGCERCRSIAAATAVPPCGCYRCHDWSCAFVPTVPERDPRALHNVPFSLPLQSSMVSVCVCVSARYRFPFYPSMFLFACGTTHILVLADHRPFTRPRQVPCYFSLAQVLSARVSRQEATALPIVYSTNPSACFERSGSRGYGARETQPQHPPFSPSA
jgi:hypothetical protein